MWRGISEAYSPHTLHTAYSPHTLLNSYFQRVQIEYASDMPLHILSAHSTIFNSFYLGRVCFLVPILSTYSTISPHMWRVWHIRGIHTLQYLHILYILHTLHILYCLRHWQVCKNIFDTGKRKSRALQYWRTCGECTCGEYCLQC